MTKPSPKTSATTEIHPFFKLLMDTGRGWQEKFATAALRQSKRHPGQKGEVPLSHVEFYQSQVFRYAKRLEGIPGQLQVIANFLAHRPKGRAFTKLGIRRGEYVAYHYRSFVVLLQTAMDVAIRLTGVTLELGLPMRDMKPSTVIENAWVTRFRLKAPLEQLQTVTSPLKRTRNEWVHAGEEPPIEHTEEIDLIEGTQHLSGEELWLSERELDRFFDIACRDLVKDISDRATALHAAVDVLLTALRSPYEYWSTRLERDMRPAKPPKLT